MLIRTTPLPEELDQGYFGRVMRLNGIDKVLEANKSLRKWAGLTSRSGREVPRALLLAKFAGLETTEFVRMHSTLPLRRGITSYKPDLEHGCSSDLSMLRTTTMRAARRGAYLCKHCVDEDLAFHGFSYWRRDHQVPGLYWCPKHNDPLHFIQDDNAFLQAPSKFLDSSMPINTPWALQAKENPVVQKYLEICFYLMERNKPVAVKSAYEVLRNKATQAGFQVNRTGKKRPLLSDHVMSLFGRPWLGTVLQELAQKPLGQLSMKLDGVLFMQRSSSSMSAYVLAASALFDTAEEAINAWTTISAEQRPLFPARHVDGEELVSAYIQAGGDYKMTAELLGWEAYTARSKLIKAGLPNLETRGQEGIKPALRALLIDHRSIEECVALGYIRMDTLSALFRIIGQPMAKILHAIDTPSGRGTGVSRQPHLTPVEVSNLFQS